MSPWAPHRSCLFHYSRAASAVRRIHSERVWSFAFAAPVNWSASAFVNRMGTILPLASPLGSFGLPGLRFTRAAPLSLLYYNNGRLVKCRSRQPRPRNQLPSKDGHLEL